MRESSWQKRKRIYKRRLLSVLFPYIESLPLEADIEPTTNCNLKCVMCQTTNWKRPVKEISLELLRRILDEIPSLRRVKLQGMGEPFMHSRLCEMIRIMAERDIEVTTVTNGVLVNETKQKKLFESGARRIYFSLDTLDPETYRKIRRGDHLKRVLENMKNTVNSSPEHLDVCTMTVVMKNNVDELYSLAEYVTGMGVKHIAFQTDLTSWGKEEWEKNNEIQAEKEKVTEVFERISSLCDKNNIELEIIKNKQLKRGHKCQWPFHQVYITCDGYVQPCCRISDPQIFTFGNMNTHAFEKIWNGADYRAFRGKLTGKNIPALCKMCYLDEEN